MKATIEKKVAQVGTGGCGIVPRMKRFGARSKMLFAMILMVLAANTFAGGAGAAHAFTQDQVDPRGVVAVELDLLDGYWRQIFSDWEKPYETPKFQWYNESEANRLVSSACHEEEGAPPTEGLESYNSITWRFGNSFYCGTDNTIYLDYKWHQYLITHRGDYASGVVLAHEWGHHVQDQLGTIDDGTSVFTELQADCLAGNFTRHADGERLLASGDYSEAAELLYIIGDHFNDHGSPQQREEWFGHGYETADPAQCNPPSETPLPTIPELTEEGLTVVVDLLDGVATDLAQ